MLSLHRLAWLKRHPSPTSVPPPPFRFQTEFEHAPLCHANPVRIGERWLSYDSNRYDRHENQQESTHPL